ncbi:hypothetical protein OO013_05660 [Mangrovivirga sp. M17]|uniref:Uncharacterized protein n=1 Tax=Mangrovivirga halotolerans TaxID=2993936 RepID=A0ABT3RP02_9BACT|nr:hypothetical protein [Mangrovivirga halotolerans]MCX2743341.1 hypothetical protein [Mangrovivirga halotolerans]
MKIEIKPHSGAGKLIFGMTRSEIREVMGKPEYSSEKSTIDYDDFSIPVPAKDGYFSNCIQISYDINNQAEFIEFSGKDEEQITILFYGVDVFNTPAPQLLRHITESTGAEIDMEDEEIPYSYVFPSLDLSLWRQVIPELNEETDEIPDSDEGKYFWTIGIGIKGYYENQ